MNVLICQLDCVWEDKEANFRRVREMLARTPPAAGSLVVLPEMFATGFSLEVARTREPAGGKSEAFLAGIAREHRCFVVGGVVHADAAGTSQNQAVGFSPDGTLVVRYTKIHPFALGGEAEVHQPGREIATFSWQSFTVAPFVCYDLRFPEIFRAAAARGADFFVVIAAWPIKRQHHWLTLLKARAIENQAYLLGVNRVGSEPHFNYAGRSILVSPHGIIVADAGEQEQAMPASVEFSVVADWRRDFPALRDRHFQK